MSVLSIENNAKPATSTPLPIYRRDTVNIPHAIHVTYTPIYVCITILLHSMYIYMYVCPVY